MREQGPWDWEKDVRAAYRHWAHRNLGKHGVPVILRVSNELAMEIQNSPRMTEQIEITKGHTTWQGIPMRVDATLPPGCFIFDEGEDNA